MALMDYRKLCPNSGHALSTEEREALRARHVTGGARTLRCEVCGRTVEACLHPGTGQSLIYAMHLREEAARPERAKGSK